MLLSQLRWRFQPLRYAASVLIQTVTVTCVGLWLVVGEGWSYPGILVGSVVGHATAAGFAFVASRDDYTFHIDREALRTMLTFSLPLVPSSIAVILYSYGDRFVIRQWLDLDAVGHYAMLARFAVLVKPMLVAAAMALTPLVMSRHRDPQTPAEVARFCRYLWLGVLACILLLAAIGPEAMALLVTTRYVPDAHLVPLLAFAFALGELYVVAPGLFIARRTRTIALINIGSAIVNLVLNIPLVQIAGLLGACVGTTISAAGALFLNMRLAQRHYPIPYPWRALGGSAGLTAVVAGMAVTVGMAFPLWDITSLGIEVATTLVGLAVAAVWLLGPELRACGVAPDNCRMPKTPPSLSHAGQQHDDQKAPHTN